MGYIEIPLEGMPDLSEIHAMPALKALLRRRNPESPPEAIAKEAERISRFRFELMRDDVVVIPIGDTLRFAEVEKKYVYQEGKHAVQVRWLAETAPRSAFKKFPRLSADTKSGLYPVGDLQLREKIRHYLPKAYRRRFAKWLWLLGILFLLKLVYLALRFGTQP